MVTQRYFQSVGILGKRAEAPGASQYFMSVFNMLCMDRNELGLRIQETGPFELPPRAMASSANFAHRTEEKCLVAGFDRFVRKPKMSSDLSGFLAQVAAVE